MKIEKIVVRRNFINNDSYIIYYFCDLAPMLLGKAKGLWSITTTWLTGSLKAND
jgi:hypothetical protein